MTVRQGIEFKPAAGWELPISRDELRLSAPASGPQADVEIHVEQISPEAAKNIRLLETVQAFFAPQQDAVTTKSHGGPV